MQVRVLFGNEFGRGNGHAAVLKQIADEIRTLHPDARLGFGLCDAAAGARMGIPATEILPTPFLAPFSTKAEAKGARTFGSGFTRDLLANGEATLARLRGWSALIADFRPDLVVAEYAPLLACAAYGKVRLAVAGEGYSLPPPELAHFLPLVEGWQTDLAEESAQLAALNALLNAAGARRLEALPQLFRADAHIMLTLPIFDPYRAVRQGDYAGVIVTGGAPRPAGGQHDSGFAYFSELESAAGAALGRGLLASGMHMDAYLAGKTAGELGLPHSGPLVLRQQLARLAEALPGKSLVVHQGSLGMSVAAAFAAVPQLVIYRHDENWVNGTAIMREGLGRAVHWPEATPERIAERMRRVTADAAFRQRALEVAQDLAPYRDRPTALNAAKRILALLP